MGNNSPRVGRRSRTKRPDLWYYDRLPPTLREALANANFNWSSGLIYNRWNKGTHVAALVDAIRRSDAGVQNPYRSNG